MLAVAAGLTVATLAVAAIVRIGWAGDVRRTLAFPFTGLPPRVDTAAAILATNARLLAAVLAAVLVAQSPWLAGRDARRGPVACGLLAAVDAVLVLAVAANTMLVGAALGAYGTRMVAAILPHGPLELAAFAAALALHLRARRGPLSGAPHPHHRGRPASRCWRSPPRWRPTWPYERRDACCCWRCSRPGRSRSAQCRRRGS